MSTETLREAAALMRRRAEAAVASPWEPLAIEDGPIGDVHEWAIYSPVAAHDFALTEVAETAEHIASWHPAVALAAAIGMECTAEALEKRGVTAHLKPAERAWIDLANAYLGAAVR